MAERLASTRPGSIIGRLRHARLGWLVSATSVAEARQLALDAAGAHAFAEAVALDRCAGAVPTMLDSTEAALGDAGLA